MLHHQVRILALCLVVGVLSACSAPGNPPSKTVQLTESGTLPGSGVGLVVGDTLELVLDGNASTGYAWEIGFIDSAVLRSLGDPEYVEAGTPERVGGEGQYTFRFLAIGEGQVELTLIYRRPFEPDVPPLRIFEVMVTVSP
jgi:inhibitor of cysteine peptidase